MTERLSEIDHLKIQLAAAKAERARSDAQIAALLFEQEVSRIAKDLGLGPTDSLDVPSGEITRAKTAEPKP